MKCYFNIYKSEIDCLSIINGLLNQLFNYKHMIYCRSSRPEACLDLNFLIFITFFQLIFDDFSIYPTKGFHYYDSSIILHSSFLPFLWMTDTNPVFHVSDTCSPFRHLSKRLLKLNNFLVPYLISSVCTPPPSLAVPCFKLAIAISTISISKCINVCVFITWSY